MSDFDRLRDLVDNDDVLQRELFAHTETVPFTAAIIRIADRFNLLVTEADVHEALAAGRSAWYATWAP